tara:strand:- start:37798 stop:39093 length:1296 start_codon:yes stop_codon:yes gene_type:complete
LKTEPPYKERIRKESDLGLARLTADPHQVGLSEESLRKISLTVQKFIDSNQLAGATTIVARHGKVAYFETLGMRNLEEQKPLEKDTIFRIYSMTKPIAAVAVMMLCEEGKLELDAPVMKYLPELGSMSVAKNSESDKVTLGSANREMTVRDLMRHTSGLPGAIRYMAGTTGVDKLFRQAGLDRLHECNLAEMVARLGSVPLLYHPGEKWHYSIAADVLGRLIEVSSQQSFDVFLTERIFRPLGMVDTDFYVPTKKNDRLAAMYGLNPKGNLRTIDAPQGGTGNLSPVAYTKKPKFLSAGGGLVATATDFMRFCLMLLNKGTLNGIRMLEQESVEEMTRNQLPQSLIPLDKKPEERYTGLGFGLGVSVRVHRTNWVPSSQVGEYGWIGGTSTEFWISPQDELVTITLAQHLPFSNLSEIIKPMVYAAIVEGK